MPCYKPLQAYRSLSDKTPNGKSKIVFKRSEAGHLSMPIALPCGRCIGCRIDKSRDWALRCVHEASQFDYNCFVTLTFNEQNINEDRTLVKADFQKFMKRLRKTFTGIKEIVKDGKKTFPIRYFHCGEYGDQLNRPHHHACLFNFDFFDKKLWSVRNGVKLYRSETLEKLWPFGFCTIGEVTFESAAYVARYVTKKITGDKAKAHYANVDYDTGEILSYREPEYVTMSRRPGIGRKWFEDWKEDVYPKDFITHEGRRFRPPRYYDKVYDLVDSEAMECIKKKRIERSKKHVDDNTPRRLVTKRKCKEAKFKKLKRGFENGSKSLLNI